MSGMGDTATQTLLPDNPAARIMPVQGGGALVLVGGSVSKTNAWHSNPLLIPATTESPTIRTPAQKLSEFNKIWKRTLGPSIPSRHRPRSDPHVITGALNTVQCPTYVVAPLRGDIDATNDVVAWTNALLLESPQSHVIFIGPVKEGGTKADGDAIEKMIESLIIAYPGHVVCIDSESESDDTKRPGHLDGLVLYGLPHTSKQVVFGYIADPDSVYSSSSRAIDCLEIETSRVSSKANGRHKSGKRMFYIHFNKSTAAYNRDKQPRPQKITATRNWRAPPGWVTKIEWPMDAPVEEMSGGGHMVLHGSAKFNIGEPSQARAGWEEGKFSKEEKLYLEAVGVTFPNKALAAFLAGAVNIQCESEMDTHTNPDCGVWRYIMNLSTYKAATSKGSAPAPTSAKGAAPTPKPTEGATPTNGPAPKPNGDAKPSNNHGDGSTEENKEEEPSSPKSGNLLIIKVVATGSPAYENTFKFPNSTTLIVAGRGDAINKERAKSLGLPDKFESMAIDGKAVAAGSPIGGIHFAIEKDTKDPTKFKLFNLHTNGIMVDNLKVPQVTNWSTHDTIENRELYDGLEFTIDKPAGTGTGAYATFTVLSGAGKGAGAERGKAASAAALTPGLEALRKAKEADRSATPGAPPGDPKPDAPPGGPKPDAPPGDPKPDDTKPGEAKPGEAKPGETKPGEAKPGDAKPEAPKPSKDAKPGDAKPGKDAKPEAPKPSKDAKPNATVKPGEAKPAPTSGLAALKTARAANETATPKKKGVGFKEEVKTSSGSTRTLKKGGGTRKNRSKKD